MDGEGQRWTENGEREMEREQSGRRVVKEARGRYRWDENSVIDSVDGYREKRERKKDKWTD